MRLNLFHKFACFVFAIAGPLIYTGCSHEASAKLQEPLQEEREPSRNWRPEQASMARHIASVHAFSIGPEPDSCLRVTRAGDQIVAEIREDVLEKLGGERALFVFGWKTNPQSCSRSDYLFFLEGLHAMLAMNAAEWRGDS